MDPVTDRFCTAVGILAKNCGGVLKPGLQMLSGFVLLTALQLMMYSLMDYLTNGAPFPSREHWALLVGYCLLGLLILLKATVILGAVSAPFCFARLGGGIGSMMGAACGMLAVWAYYATETPQPWPLIVCTLVLMAIGGLFGSWKPSSPVARTASSPKA